MKNLLLLTASILALGALTPAFGADLAAQPIAKAPPPPVTATLNDWTGYYIGINGGWGSSRNCWDAGGILPEGCHDAVGGTLGGQIGYRWQIFNTVYGLEAQGNWANFSGSNVSAAFPADTIRTRVDAFGLLTGQIGYAVNNVLLYAKGGAAVTSNTYQINAASTGTELAKSDNIRWGGTIGAGFEVSLTPSWSVGVEYDHLFMPDSNLTFTTAAGGVATDRISQDIDLVTARLNYRFGPALPKY